MSNPTPLVNYERADRIILYLEEQNPDIAGAPDPGTVVRVTAAQRQALAECVAYDIYPSTEMIEFRPIRSGGNNEIVVLERAYGVRGRADIYPSGSVHRTW